MGDGDDGLALPQLLDGILDVPFGLGVHGGSGFVQDQDGRIL